MTFFMKHAFTNLSTSEARSGCMCLDAYFTRRLSGSIVKLCIAIVGSRHDILKYVQGNTFLFCFKKLTYNSLLGSVFPAVNMRCGSSYVKLASCTSYRVACPPYSNSRGPFPGSLVRSSSWSLLYDPKDSFTRETLIIETCCRYFKRLQSRDTIFLYIRRDFLCSVLNIASASTGGLSNSS